MRQPLARELQPRRAGFKSVVMNVRQRDATSPRGHGDGTIFREMRWRGWQSPKQALAASAHPGVRREQRPCGQSL